MKIFCWPRHNMISCLAMERLIVMLTLLEDGLMELYPTNFLLILRRHTKLESWVVSLIWMKIWKVALKSGSSMVYVASKIIKQLDVLRINTKFIIAILQWISIFATFIAITQKIIDQCSALLWVVKSSWRSQSACSFDFFFLHH